MGDVSSLDLDSALTEDNTEASPATGGAEAGAAGNDSEARQRHSERP
jgi:hypothetical protein